MENAAQQNPDPGRRLPDFLVIGAAKSGTSTLHHLLDQHPGIYMSAVKEPCFFDVDVGWSRGWSWYHDLFDPASSNQLCGESSTNYTRIPQVSGVPERIHAAMPDVKLIYLMRHPVDRAYSHYVHRVSRELYQGQPVRLSFEEFAEQDPMCLDSSDYKTQIEAYFARFPREAFLFLLTSDLKSPARLMSRVGPFLGLEPCELNEGVGVSNANVDFHEGKVRQMLTAPLQRAPRLRKLVRLLPQSIRDGAYQLLRRSHYGKRVSDRYTPAPMRPETRARLIDHFLPSIEFVRDELDLDVDSWLV